MVRTGQAQRFHALHRGPGVLAILNAWDAGSARVFEQAGCAAIGTTSAGIAYALGRPDGEALTRAELVEATARIAAATELPLTADVESGYGATPAEVGETVAAVIAAGAVGVNLEDAAPEGGAALRDLDDQCARLRAARAAAEDAGVPLFLNARTDAAWLGVGPAEQRRELIAARARAYAEAGADGIFAPGVSEPDELAALVAATPLPVNVLATRTTPSLDELERLGVRRLSVGSGPVRAALDLAGRIALEVLETGSSELMVAGTLTYREANALFR
ncbi:isocitrate lyase/phosphoenolpyruvate mutase family protein [Conexibacter sp. JD483]|uniref:isocitrate lyase/PEP mutase family protein n=1 Tax=unclassified Conexibacter TaxID=2627773 RepID=UPI002721784C|nr:MULTISPECIES: isocitrate lyase/phosphoenolpyruvate mutase family protein [unclassified Conexibacter]MDO8186482.1 isocitrate lyase/phosphoenolpyruvate mutase family protein [Conexibacter sp. CPCC 205706]MDO8200051.1 isocitrate lyase/phosphoenolpyruvate mutase family protein [Conexibacter sp. CPCC 205762]MDR9372277.1 isocitrate lyase/phosphoenolpyruvate mutase family protein [Conexibacter sp. JD483]